MLIAIENCNAVVTLLLAIDALLHAHGIIIGDKYHITHIELPVRVDVWHMRQVLYLVAQRQSEVHFIGAGGGVGNEGYITLVKGIVAIIAQALHYKISLGIKFLVVKK